MSEGTLTDKSLFLERCKIGELMNEVGHGIEFPQVFLGKGFHPELQGDIRYYGAEIGVSAPLPVAVYGSLNLGRSLPYGVKGVSDPDLAVVMGVYSQARVIEHAVNFPYGALDVPRHGAAVCVA